MQYRRLGHSDTDVSVICLGTMTWGEQNTQAEAFERMDYALARGVNFSDTAELYPIPPKAGTYGRTEEIIGHRLQQTGNRDRIVLASKIAGPGPGWVDHIRQGRTHFNREYLQAALEGLHEIVYESYVDVGFLILTELVRNRAAQELEKTVSRMRERLTAG